MHDAGSAGRDIGGTPTRARMIRQRRAAIVDNLRDAERHPVLRSVTASIHCLVSPYHSEDPQRYMVIRRRVVCGVVLAGTAAVLARTVR